jgi:hypothetical protein
MIGRGHRGATKLAFRSLNSDSIGCCGSLVVTSMPRVRVNSESREPAASAGVAVRRQSVWCVIRAPVAVVVKAAAGERNVVGPCGPRDRHRGRRCGRRRYGRLRGRRCGRIQGPQMPEIGCLRRKPRLSHPGWLILGASGKKEQAVRMKSARAARSERVGAWR